MNYLSSAQIAFSTYDIVESIERHLQDITDRRHFRQINTTCRQLPSLTHISEPISLTKVLELGREGSCSGLFDITNARFLLKLDSFFGMVTFPYDHQLALQQLESINQEEEVSISVVPLWRLEELLTTRPLQVKDLILWDEATYTCKEIRWKEMFKGIKNLIAMGHQDKETIGKLCNIFQPRQVHCNLQIANFLSFDYNSLTSLSIPSGDLDRLCHFPTLEVLEVYEVEVIKCTTKMQLPNLKSFRLRYIKAKIKSCDNLDLFRPQALTSVSVDCAEFKIGNVDEFFRKNQWPKSVLFRGRCWTVPRIICPFMDYLPSLVGKILDVLNYGFQFHLLNTNEKMKN